MQRCLLVLAPILGLNSCVQPKAPWWEQLEAGGACHEVNLLDGLDVDSSTEIQNTAYCLNQNGNLDPLMPMVDALTTPARDGVEAGIHLARAVESLRKSDLDVFGAAETLLEWLQSDTGLFEEILKNGVELTYAQPYSVLADNPAPSSQSAIDNGVLAPLLSALRTGLIAQLDNSSPDAASTDENSETLLSLLYTLSGLIESPDEGFQNRINALLTDIGVAIQSARSPENDRTSQATGNSIEDFAKALMLHTTSDGKNALRLAEEAVGDLFEDQKAQDRVLDAMTRLSERGSLRTLPLQMRYLGTVDAAGGTLGPNEDSSLVSLLRLLHNANAPISCKVQWGFGSYEINLGNLSIALFEAIASADPEITTDSVDLLGEVLDLPLTEEFLEIVAELGVCPVLNPQFVIDIKSIDRLNDPQSGDLLIAMIEVLKALGEGSDSRIPEMVDLVSIPHELRASEPLEELLRDLGGSALFETMAAFSGPVLSPEDFVDKTAFPEGISPLSFADIWEALNQGFSIQSNGLSPLQEADPILSAVLRDQYTWKAVGALGELLSNPKSRSSDLLSMLPSLLAMDPKLEFTLDLMDKISGASTENHLALVMEIDVLHQALISTQIDAQGPLPFFAELELSGSLESLLGTINRTIGLWVVSEE